VKPARNASQREAGGSVPKNQNVLCQGLTPFPLFYGMAQNIYEDRAQVLKSAFDLNPKRFKGNVPKPPILPKAAWINKPAADSVLYD